MSAIRIAPMMDVSDRWFRRVMRRLAPSVEVWTEMVVADAILHGDPHVLLARDDTEHPVVQQLGGDDPAKLVQAARIVEDFGYDAVNLNVGCPSSRVQSGRFGAVLMRDPERVAEIVAALRAAVQIPVHVKHRIGVDELDAYEHMRHFVDTVAQAGCTTFIVHARKAWLQGLSPKDNRTIPPLRHAEVHRLKAERPHLEIVTNGGITDTPAVRAHLAAVDGVMIGRAAVDTPWWVAQLAHEILGDPAPGDPCAFAEGLDTLIAQARAEGQPASRVTRHVMHLFAGQPGARRWRRALSEQRDDADGGLAAALAAYRSAQEAA